MKDRLRQLILPLKLFPEATRKSLELVEENYGIGLPEDYVALMLFSNGAEGRLGNSSDSFIIIWPIEDVIVLNEGYGVSNDYPELVIFGKDAATAAYAFDIRFSPMPVIEVDLIDPEYRKEVGGDFLDFMVRHSQR